MVPYGRSGVDGHQGLFALVGLEMRSAIELPLARGINPGSARAAMVTGYVTYYYILFR